MFELCFFELFLSRHFPTEWGCSASARSRATGPSERDEDTMKKFQLFINGEATLLLDPQDPFRSGIR